MAAPTLTPRMRLRTAEAGLAVLCAAACLGCGGAASPRDAAGATPEAGPVIVDAGDAGPKDSGSDARDAALPPVPYPRPVYQHLSETGLFSDLLSRAIEPSATAFEPTYKLWSDGATKRRWIRLPPGTKIDTSDMDHWVFPIGTQLWKEFSLNGVLLETRLVERYGTGPEDYWMGAFVWNAEQTDADLAPDGAQNVGGTPHDVPTQKDCGVCHRGDVGRVLGFSAIQLTAPATGPDLRALDSAGLLSQGPAPGGYPLGADPATAAALGYLHANCGHCHNPNGTSWPDTQMVLRSVVADTGLEMSLVVRSIVGVPLEYWRGGAITLRVESGRPDQSAVVERTSGNGEPNPTPPLATEVVDATGLETVRQWIAGLPSD
jgi:hypothetical protein